MLIVNVCNVCAFCKLTQRLSSKNLSNLTTKFCFRVIIKVEKFSVIRYGIGESEWNSAKFQVKWSKFSNNILLFYRKNKISQNFLDANKISQNFTKFLRREQNFTKFLRQEPNFTKARLQNDNIVHYQLNFMFMFT